MSEGSGNRRGFFEKVTFEATSEGRVGADQSNTGRGGRERDNLPDRRAECRKGKLSRWRTRCERGPGCLITEVRTNVSRQGKEHVGGGNGCRER